MARKPRRKHSARPLLGSRAGDQYLLDAFCVLDLQAWEAAGEANREYAIRVYHELEAQRQVYKDELIAALRLIDAERLGLKGWGRIVDYRYSDQPLSAAGSLKRGGRFNIGTVCDQCSAERFAALYIAEDHATAMREKFGADDKSQGLSATDLALRDAGSYSYVRVAGAVDRVFPLSRAATLKPFTDVIRDFRLPQEVVKLGRRIGLGGSQTVGSPKVLMRTLLDPAWRYLSSNHGLPANSQVFGALLRDAGFEGVVYQSARGHGRCLALFPDTLDHSGTRVALNDAAPDSTSVTTLDATTWQQLV